MTKEIRQRVALVSGGGSGIGLAIVKQLLAAGFHVGFFGRSREKIRTAEAELRTHTTGAKFLGLTGDVSSKAEIAEIVGETTERFGPIDTLVYSAGISPKIADGMTAVPFNALSVEEWNAVLATNLTGAMVCCQALLPQMMERRFGRVVFVGSIAARTVPRLAGTAYAASKAGLSGLARSLIATASGTGVTINTIAPGHIVTEMTGGQAGQHNPDAISRIPVGRLGLPEDVASMVRYLVSENAGFVNGAVIDVNGGEFTPL
ncbi:SDR family NAD(P)-dependent oxidoreductase [Affinirhizobium pseudoryzae]|uniref:SDR family NAD(P)-dependent oxidoreductase n=1 Tax=Allorhizobium pseudoryzae TaxID=379684 RepID=UPI0013EA6770|nr:SDR family NAD(P)-dependent oxidoreductase [Allorhizobium pseudoryzae]